MDEAKLHDVVAGLRQSKKYRTICEATVERTARWALARYPQPKHALKMAKNKLHQVYGAYLEGIAVERVLSELDDATPDSIRNVCQTVLESHASTRERLEFIDPLYPSIFDVAGLPSSVRDLACGLHPFALPWMDLPPTTRYIPSDIDTRLRDLHNAVLRALGMAPLAECDDVLVDRLREPVDLTFLLKALPCLEQQEKGAAERVLAAMKSTWLVVSFPTRSLGGRNKHMGEHYAAQYEPLVRMRGSIEARLEFANELFYVVKMG